MATRGLGQVGSSKQVCEAVLLSGHQLARLRPLLPSRGQCLVSAPVPACHVWWAALNWDPGSYSLSPTENSEAVGGGGGDTGSKTQIIPLPSS